jgi:hypothetical protein
MSWRPTTSRTPPAGSDGPGGDPGAWVGRPITPASRLLFWIRAAFVGDAAVAAFGGILLAIGAESAAFAVLAFAAIRAALGVAALLIALRALEHRNPNDDRPSSVR